MTDEPQKGGYIRQAWLVILLAFVYGAALAGTQSLLGERIEENKTAEAFREVPGLVQAAKNAPIEPMTLLDANGNEKRVYQVKDDDGSIKGWVIPAQGQGFADRIELLVGLNSDASRITGLYVLDQKETPNLGAMITDPSFLKQYDGKSTKEPVKVVTSEPTGAQEIRAITGATISSDAVTNIVNQAVKDLKKSIQEQRTAKP